MCTKLEHGDNSEKEQGRQGDRQVDRPKPGAVAHGNLKRRGQRVFEIQGHAVASALLEGHAVAVGQGGPALVEGFGDVD